MSARATVVLHRETWRVVARLSLSLAAARALMA